MAYTATVCKLSNLKPLEGTDKLSIAFALGYMVVVGRDTDSNELGIVFPEGGCLSQEMLLANKLYRKHPETGEPMGGYFEENGRVKAIKLRGTKSEAFWTPVSSLAWTGAKLNRLEEGDTIVELNGKLICEKYYTKATLKAIARQKKAQGKSEKFGKYVPDFVRHFDTKQLRDYVQHVTGSKTEWTVTEKLHGTSGRTGRVKYTKRNLLQQFLALFGLHRDKYIYVTGTRNVEIPPDKMGQDTGYYSGTEFRAAIHNMIVAKGLRENEVLYYEIVGFTDRGKPIMDVHGLSEATLKESGIPTKEWKQYGEQMLYSYGCEPGQYKVYIYRIVQDGKDLTFSDMAVRAAELGLDTVPVLGFLTIEETDTVEDVISKTELFTRGNSTLDDTHIKEGVCLRMDTEPIRVLKYKSFFFCVLEGIRKNTESYVDFEEMS